MFISPLDKSLAEELSLKLVGLTRKFQGFEWLRGTPRYMETMLC